jgi:hypothetical protein
MATSLAVVPRPVHRQPAQVAEQRGQRQRVQVLVAKLQLAAQRHRQQARQRAFGAEDGAAVLQRTHQDLHQRHGLGARAGSGRAGRGGDGHRLAPLRIRGGFGGGGGAAGRDVGGFGGGRVGRGFRQLGHHPLYLHVILQGEQAAEMVQRLVAASGGPGGFAQSAERGGVVGVQLQHAAPRLLGLAVAAPAGQQLAEHGVGAGVVGAVEQAGAQHAPGFFGVAVPAVRVRELYENPAGIPGEGFAELADFAKGGLGHEGAERERAGRRGAPGRWAEARGEAFAPCAADLSHVFWHGAPPARQSLAPSGTTEPGARARFLRAGQAPAGPRAGGTPVKNPRKLSPCAPTRRPPRPSAG